MADHDPHSLSRREFVRVASSITASALTGGHPSLAFAAEAPARPVLKVEPHPFLTPADSFRDVSRGTPSPHSLTGSALINARLTPETWRLEMSADATRSEGIAEPARIGQSLSIADGTALDLSALLDLGRTHGVKFLKAMQCLNIPIPLGQGLWEGVPLRVVLRLCGSMRNVRRLYYWGFHNNDPKQLFQSSISYTQAMETAPGDLPPFLAYRLNGEPIPLMRGGPVRMIIPWAYGFKSTKWLQKIVLTNDYRANDTYAEQNNDPESNLKTAAYFDKLPEKVRAGSVMPITGLALAGLSGLKRVEYSLRSSDSNADTHEWIPCELANPPAHWSRILPANVQPGEVLGFDRKTGRPSTWPMRYTMVPWFTILKGLAPGSYELSVRAVDMNNFAQPEPRPIQKSGVNAVEIHQFRVIPG